MLYDVLLALLPSLCVSIIMALYNHRQSKRYKAAQAREALRAEGEAVQVSLLVSTAKLSYALAMARVKILFFLRDSALPPSADSALQNRTGML